MTTVVLHHDYDAAPRDVWAVATDWDCFIRAMEGVAAFRGLPDEPLHEGQRIEAEVSLFGKLPWQPHVMQLERFDPEAMEFQSREASTGVKRWDHHLTVTAHKGGALLTDTIEIEAERFWMTPLFVLWARFVYRRRHAPRLAMLATPSLKEA